MGLAWSEKDRGDPWGHERGHGCSWGPHSNSWARPARVEEWRSQARDVGLSLLPTGFSAPDTACSPFRSVPTQMRVLTEVLKF